MSFDPLGNWLLTGISNAPGTSAYFSTATASAATVGPAMVAAGAGMQGIYRLERVEQDQERTLQSRYQVSIRTFLYFFFACHIVFNSFSQRFNLHRRC